MNNHIDLTERGLGVLKEVSRFAFVVDICLDVIALPPALRISLAASSAFAALPA
jgi:hypothetical protein